MRKLYPNITKAERQLRSLKRWRGRFTLVNRVLTAGITVVCCAFLLTSPHLAVRSISVAGAPPEMQSFLDANLDGARGLNLFRLKTRELEKRIAAHPYVRELTVRKKLPGTIHVNITCRKPFASVACHGKVFVIDAELVPYKVLDQTPPDLPVMEVPGANEPVLGKRWKSNYLTSAQRCLLAAKDRSLQVERVTLNPGGDLVLDIRNSIQIRAGSPQDIEQKLWAASRFLVSSAVQPGSIEYVDVSCPTAPAYLPKQAAVEASQGGLSGE